jgi:hypothetical protein
MVLLKYPLSKLAKKPNLNTVNLSKCENVDIANSLDSADRLR